MAIDEGILRKLIEESGLISEQDINAAAKVANHIGCSIADVLLGRDLLSEENLGSILSRYYNVGYVNLTLHEIQPEVLNLIPEDLAATRSVIAFKLEGGNLHLGMEDPGNLDTTELVKKTIGNDYNIIPYVATQTGLKSALKLYKHKSQDDTISSASVASEEISVVATIEKLLEDAIRQDVSDIHIEALENKVLIRFRIDGVLIDYGVYSKASHDSIVARVKILSDLKLDESRLPQDGQFSYKTKSGEEKSLRVSIIPTVHGEKVVLRILDHSQTRFNLDDLGLLQEDKELITRVLEKSYGMFLVTGPTGSGKTTSLYTILGLLNKPDTNIITIEDPVENKISRVNQIQVNDKIGLSFASGLRSILRQDPDIIMVGEIRDKETAVISVNSAMTGHLVFSTVHANTAPGAIPRMIDLGIEPFLLASTLNLVVAQRLVRVLCTKCKSEIELSPLVYKKLQEARSFVSDEIFAKVTKNYTSSGCQFCFKTGFRGRIGIFELLPIGDNQKELIVAKATSNEIWNRAREEGVKGMLEDGLIKVTKGITSLEEVFRVISS